MLIVTFCNFFSFIILKKVQCLNCDMVASMWKIVF